MGKIRYKFALLGTFWLTFVSSLFLFANTAEAGVCVGPNTRHVIVPIDYSRPFYISEAEKTDDRIRFRPTNRGNWFKFCYDYRANAAGEKSPIMVFFNGGPGSQSIGVDYAHDQVKGFFHLKFDLRGVYQNAGALPTEDNSHIFPDRVLTSEWNVADMFMVLNDLNLKSKKEIFVFGASYGTVPSTIFSHVISYYNGLTEISKSLPREFDPRIFRNHLLPKVISAVNLKIDLKATMLLGTVGEIIGFREVANAIYKNWDEFLYREGPAVATLIDTKLDATSEQKMQIMNSLFMLLPTSGRRGGLHGGEELFHGNKRSRWAEFILNRLTDGYPVWPGLSEQIVGAIARDLNVKNAEQLPTLFPEAPTGNTYAVLKHIQHNEYSPFDDNGGNYKGQNIYDSKDFQIAQGKIVYFAGSKDNNTPVRHAHVHFKNQKSTNKTMMVIDELGHSMINNLHRADGTDPQCKQRIFDFIKNGWDLYLLKNDKNFCSEIAYEYKLLPEKVMPISEELIAEKEKTGKHSLSGFTAPKQ